MSYDVVSDDLGQIFHLRFDSPEAVKVAVLTSVRRWRLARCVHRTYPLALRTRMVHVDYMPLDRIDPRGIHPIHGDQREDVDLDPAAIALGPKRYLMMPGYVSLAATYKQALGGSVQRKMGIERSAEH